MASDPSDIEPGAPQPIEMEPRRARTADPPKAVSALWYRLGGIPWSTLAVVAPGNGAGAWRIALALVDVAEKVPRPLRSVNAIDANLDRLAAVGELLAAETLEAAVERPRFVLAVDSPLENPATIGLLSICDAVVLLVERRRTRIPDGQRILELVGPERFIGAVLYPE